MSENKTPASQNDYEVKSPVTESAFYTTIDNLYKKVISDVYTRLQALKAELNNELKYTSAQINAYCEITQRDSAVMVERNQMAIDAISNELKYGYQQNQMIHEDLVHLVGEDLMAKIDTVDGKLELLKEIEKIIPAVEKEIAAVNAKIDAIEFPVAEIKEKIDEAAAKYEAVDYDKISQIVSEACAAATECGEEPELVTYEGIEQCIDYAKIEGAVNTAAEEVNAKVSETKEAVEQVSAALTAQTEDVLTQVKEVVANQTDDLMEKVSDKTVELLNEQTEKTSEKMTAEADRVVNAINSLQMPENVDYELLAEKVGEKVLEMLREAKEAEEAARKEAEEAELAAATVTEEVVEDTVTEEVAEEATEEVVEEPAEEAVEETAEESVEEATEETTEEGVEKCAEETVEEVVEEKVEFNVDEIVERVAAKVVECLYAPEEVNYKQIEEIVQASAVDVNALADTVAEKVLEKTPTIDIETIDYDRIGDVVAEKVPTPEGIDYERLAETVIAKMPVPEAINYDTLAETVIAKMPVPEAINYDTLADAVIAKMPVPEAIDYEALSDMIVSKMPKPVEPQPVDYETLAEMVTAKMLASEEEKEAPSYDVILDDDGISAVANGVFERLDMDVIAEKVAEKMPVPEKEEINYELLADMVADRLAVKVVEEVLVEEETAEEAPVEEVVEEVVEETPVEEVVEEVVTEEAVEEVIAEEVVEEVTEEVVEEAPVVEETVEEVVEETPVEEVAQEEVAATLYESEDGELVDAQTGLVVRLKRSFSAKLKQSDESVKVFYDQIKNELVSYKKVKSTVSWHGDRFNLGRATVAKMNICGKTLCFYIALDPADPELKETVYHQKNVGDQKAYQATPFKVKVKSDMGAKRAVRLVNILADKIGATKKPDFVPTDYVEEFSYETTQELLEKGLIKETQEKKIDFEF